MRRLTDTLDDFLEALEFTRAHVLEEHMDAPKPVVPVVPIPHTGTSFTGEREGIAENDSLSGE